MSMGKLTLSADAKIILLAKEQARSDGISLSAMFSSFILSRSRKRSSDTDISPGPLTRQALNLGRESSRVEIKMSDREVVEEALNKKYDLNS